MIIMCYEIFFLINVNFDPQFYCHNEHHRAITKSVIISKIFEMAAEKDFQSDFLLKYNEHQLHSAYDRTWRSLSLFSL